MKSSLSTKILPGILLFICFLAIYTFTMAGRIRFGDEGERYLTAQSLVDRHDLAIRIQPGLHRKIGVDGRNYSSYELGSILPLVPFYAVGSALAGFFSFADHNWIEMLFAGLFNPVITALTVLLLYKSLEMLGSSTRSAIVAAGLFGIATVAWPYAQAFEREPVLAFSLLLTIYTAYKFRQSKNMIWLWATGASAGFFVFAKIANIILLPFFALYLLFVVFEHEKKPSLTSLLYRGVIFAIPIALFIGASAIYNQVRFGNFTDLGLESTWGNPLSYFGFSNMFVALNGMLFSPAKSIFIYSPPALLFVFAWIPFFKQYKLEALLIASLIVVSILFNAMNINWDQASWWGPKYLVPLTPLFLLPIALVLDHARGMTKRLWLLLVALTAFIGLAVQIPAVLVDDREYLDITGAGINLAGAFDFLRHGAIDSLVVYLSPQGLPIQVNPFGIVLLIVAVLFGVLIIRRMRSHAENSGSWRIGLAIAASVLLIEFAAFIVWIITPYPQVLAAQGNSKFVAANAFLADGRTCEASALYQIAIQSGTMYRQQAVAQLNRLAPLPHGTTIDASELLAQPEITGGGFIQVDGTTTITGNGSLMASSAKGEDVIARGHGNPITVLPNTTYEMSGWIKTMNVYGEGFGSVTVSEDDGAYRNIRDTDVALQDQTNGWTRFHKTLTTLPTTHRLFIAAGLWKSFGTVWVDGLQVAQVTKDNPALADSKPCN